MKDTNITLKLNHLKKLVKESGLTIEAGKDDEKKKVKGKKLFEENKFLDLNMNKGLYENKKKENEVNMLEELIFNDDKNKDDDEN